MFILYVLKTKKEVIMVDYAYDLETIDKLEGLHYKGEKVKIVIIGHLMDEGMAKQITDKLRTVLI